MCYRWVDTVVRRTDDTENDSDADIFSTEEAVELYTDRIADPTFFPQERKAVDRYFTDTDSRILDVGCGSGRVSHLLSERGFDVTGIDVSEPLVAQARAHFPDIDFRVADVRDTDFDSATFDHVVFSYFGLDYVVPESERLSALREMYRLLKPAGFLVFSSHNNWHPVFAPLVGSTVWAVRDLWDFYLRETNRKRLFSRYKMETIPLGEAEIYLSNPVRQWLQLRTCGFTPVDVIGRSDGVSRFFERDPHYVAKK